MATRHHARAAVIGLLYAYDLGNKEIEKFSDEILDERKIRNKQREFSYRLFRGTIKNLKEIDELIKSHLDSWKFDELGKIEKAILRLGTYEMLKEDIDEAIVINEAIELAKELADDDAPKFINGVLDAIKKDLKGDKKEKNESKEDE
ncbi:MAG: transcription antitermination factor NusB [Epsilonproteobacteria bacterium]|nr:transcription antitermination factor NusB [Campylobacterota bacterium]